MSDPTKPPLHLVPLRPLADIAKVLQYGIKGDRKANDWMTMPDARQRLFSAAIRHMSEAQYADCPDAESGMSHMAHAATNLLLLLWHEQEQRQPERQEASRG